MKVSLLHAWHEASSSEVDRRALCSPRSNPRKNLTSTPVFLGGGVVGSVRRGPTPSRTSSDPISYRLST